MCHCGRPLVVSEFQLTLRHNSVLIVQCVLQAGHMKGWLPPRVSELILDNASAAGCLFRVVRVDVSNRSGWEPCSAPQEGN